MCPTHPHSALAEPHGIPLPPAPVKDPCHWDFPKKEGLNHREIQMQQSVNEMGRERAVGPWEHRRAKAQPRTPLPRRSPSPAPSASTQADSAGTGQVSPLPEQPRKLNGIWKTPGTDSITSPVSHSGHHNPPGSPTHCWHQQLGTGHGPSATHGTAKEKNTPPPSPHCPGLCKPTTLACA